MKTHTLICTSLLLIWSFSGKLSHNVYAQGISAGQQKPDYQKTLDSLKHSMHVEFDNIGNQYIVKASTSAQSLDVNGFFADVLYSDLGTHIRLHMQYSGEDFIFIKNVSVTADGNHFDLSLKNAFHDKYVATGRIDEWDTEEMDKKLFDEVETIAKSQSVTIR